MCGKNIQRFSEKSAASVFRIGSQYGFGMFLQYIDVFLLDYMT